MPASCAASSASAICFLQSPGPHQSTIRFGSWFPAPDAIRSRVFAFHQFHHQGVALEAVDLRDVRMVQRGESLRLAGEPRGTVGVAREEMREDLDRDLALQLRVARAIDLTHTSSAERRDDFVRTDPVSGNERHVVGCRIIAGPRSRLRERRTPRGRDRGSRWWRPRRGPGRRGCDRRGRCGAAAAGSAPRHDGA